MKARPILMNGDMVGAVIDGRKTQTRRMVKDAPGVHVLGDDGSGVLWDACPYGQPGDVLYVRETFAPCADGDISYAADNKLAFLKYTPSIHMPRWASRLTLEITGVRVERLQDISEGDAISEGLEPSERFEGRYMTPKGNYARPHVAFMRLWDSIYGNWSDNPWVWVVEFKPHMVNVDKLMEKRAA